MSTSTAVSRSGPGDGPVRAVSVISTGTVQIRPEHPYGSRKPMYWWLLTSRQWTPPRPVNVYVIEHESGLLLFDTGQDRASVTGRGYFLKWRQVTMEPTRDGSMTYDAEIMKRGQLPGVGNRRKLADSTRKVLTLAERLGGLVILPAHDPGAASRLRDA
jgi:hypothetical protein